MENKLIPLTEFVNRIDELVPENKTSSNRRISEVKDKYETIKRYAAFLSQPLTLSMFVPCDDNGNVLQDPGLIPSQQLNDYREAKEKVLFEGFEIDENYLFSKKTGHDIFFKYPYGWRLDNVSCEIIEDLVRFDLTLVSLKQIFG